MTIDERIEALTHSLELISAQQEEDRKAIHWNRDGLLRVEAGLYDLETKLGRLTDKVERIADLQLRLEGTVDRFIRAQGNGSNGGSE